MEGVSLLRVDEGGISTEGGWRGYLNWGEMEWVSLLVVDEWGISAEGGGRGYLN